MDLDINSYSDEELIAVLKLDLEYCKEDLLDAISKFQKIIQNNTDYSEVYRNELIRFFKKAQERLLVKVTNISNSNNDLNYKKYELNTKKNINTPYESFSVTNNVDTLNNYNNNYEKKSEILNKQKPGTIIGPLTNINNNVLQYQRIPTDNINGYNKNKIVSSYVFNSQYRNNFFNTLPEECEFTLPNTINNIMSITLSGFQFKNTIFAFSSERFTNQIYIEEDTSGGIIGGIVTIPDGNYNEDDFCKILETCINTQIIDEDITENEYRFHVTISKFSYCITISNILNTFTIKTLVENKLNYRLNDLDSKSKISASKIIKSMGYQMGFRNIEYNNEKSYTTESTFTSDACNYIYFSLDDFNNSTINRTYGMLAGQNILDDNILAIIPLDSNSFSKNYINNSNFVNKTREYSIPINISKIKIKLMDNLGEIINNNYNDFSFTLEIVKIRDNQKF